MIRAEKLSKRYGPTLAVDAVSFEIDQGEIVGFLGPNGAGKTTTMRMSEYLDFRARIKGLSCAEGKQRIATLTRSPRNEDFHHAEDSISPAC